MHVGLNYILGKLYTNTILYAYVVNTRVIIALHAHYVFFMTQDQLSYTGNECRGSRQLTHCFWGKDV